MDLYYSHSYEDPETGEVVDVMVDDDDGLRNANPRVTTRRPVPRPQRYQQQRVPTRYPTPPAPRPRPQPPVYPNNPAPAPVTAYPYPYQPQPVVVTGDHVSIRKGALLEIIPAIGKVWASFLGMPDKPAATGNDITDRDNAAAHREALAQHSQNQTRILALTELASQAVKAFLR